MAATTAGLGYSTDSDLALRQQALHQRGFAHSRCAEQDAGVAVELSGQFVETGVLSHAGEQHRITQRLIDRELRLPLRQLRVIQQIDLVDHDDRFDALYMRANQYAIQIQRIERDLRAEYHD